MGEMNELCTLFISFVKWKLNHTYVFFNSQTWNDRFLSCLSCLLLHSPQGMEVMLQTDFALKQMLIAHSLPLYSREMEKQLLNWRISRKSCELTLFFSVFQQAANLIIITGICQDCEVFVDMRRFVGLKKEGCAHLPLFPAPWLGSPWQVYGCDIWKNKVRGC